MDTVEHMRSLRQWPQCELWITSSGLSVWPSEQLWHPDRCLQRLHWVRRAAQYDTGCWRLICGWDRTTKFYYMTRFMFAFILIAVFFAVCSLLLGFFALCSRIGSYLSSVMCFIAMFFQTLVAALMTWVVITDYHSSVPSSADRNSANYVIARNDFMANNQTASLGSYAFGFVWAAMACLLIASSLFFVAGSSARKDSYSSRSGFLGRKKSTKSRGSFIDNDASRWVVWLLRDRPKLTDSSFRRA